MIEGVNEMSLIDILVTTDGEKIAQQVSDGSLDPGSQANPTNLGSYTTSDVYIAMITQNNNVDNNTQGQSELQVKANAGDTIRWTMQTFGSNVDYTAYLYDGNFNPSENISPLVYMNMHTSVYLPPSTSPTADPVLLHNYIYAAQGTVIEYGDQIQYTLSFALVDNQTGENIGYFSWDPFINVSQ